MAGFVGLGDGLYSRGEGGVIYKRLKHTWKSLGTTSLEEAREKLQGEPKEQVQKRSKGKTVNEFAKIWFQNYIRLNRCEKAYINTEWKFRMHVAPVIGHLLLSELKEDHCIEIRNHCDKAGLAPRTTKDILQDWCNFLNCAKKERLIKEVPFTVRAMPKLKDSNPYVLTTEQVKTLLEIVEARPDYKAIVKLAVLTGMRWGELAKLQWSDYKEKPFPHLRIDETKNKKARSVPLTPEAVELIKWIDNTFGHDRVLLFPYIPVRSMNLSKWISSRVKFPFHFHCLRRTYITRQLENGMNKEALRLIVGHSNLNIIDKYYSNISDDLVFNEINRLYGVK